MSTAIKIENVSKLYRLGTVGTGTISHDINRWWHTIRGKEDPYAKVGQVNDRTKKAASIENRDASDDSPTDSQLATRNSSLRSSAPDYVWALRDINLEVQQGDIIGIIGRNGAGKSTLLKLLSRVTAPTTGSIKTKGRIASLLEVGTGFHPELTGRENIYLNGAILGMKRHEITKQLDEIVEFSGCAKYLDTPVKRYSSGMMVRLGFAVAAHLDCEILIIDEVLAVGDAEFQRKCIGKMQSVSKSNGKTVLFVSHNMSSIERLCRKGAVLGEGQVQCTGTVSQCVDSYLTMNNADDWAGKLQTEQDRQGSGLARLRSVRMFSDSGDSVTAMRSGDSLNVVFEIENMTNQDLTDVSVGYSIGTVRGEQLIVSYSDYEGRVFTLKPGYSEISVVLTPPFRDGVYQFGFRMLIQSLEADWPKYPVSELTLEGGERAGLAAVAHSGRGLVLLDNVWQQTHTGHPTKEQQC